MCGGIGIAVVTALLFLGVIPANAVPARSDVVSTFENVDSTTTGQSVVVLGDVEPLVESNDAGHALSATVSGTDIVVPSDAAGGLKLGHGDVSMTIGLPFASQASDAVVEAPGIVSYDNNNGSTTVPVVKADGSVQITTIIDGPNSPSVFDYKLDVPTAGSLVLNVDGSAAVLDAEANPALLIDIPWAKDANGTDVPTHYEVDGEVLTQIIDLTDPSIAYPVIADPRVSYLWWGVAIKLNHSETVNLSNNFTPAYFTSIFCGFAGPAAPVCALAVSIRIWTWQKPVMDAANNGRCAQLNYPYGLGPGLWNVTNEAC